VKKKLNVWVEEEIYNKAKEVAKLEERSLSGIIRLFLNKYIKEGSEVIG